MTTDTTLAGRPHLAMRRALTLGLPMAAALGWLVPLQAHAAALTQRRTLLGTMIDLQIHHADLAVAEAAASAAWREMGRLETMMSRYVPGNALSDLHASAGTSARPVPPELFQVLLTAQAMSARSRGAFDITVGALKDWDFRPGLQRAAQPAAIREQLALVRSDDLELDARTQTARLRRVGMRLDLGGIAKLPILQAGMDVLQLHGIRSAMINGGGDVLVRGGNQGVPWRIGIRDPRQPDQLLGTVALHEGVVASSGDYERCFDQNGRRYHHVLDPRTGYPSTGAHGAVFVAPESSTVNGWGATTLVAGPRFAQAQVQRHASVAGLVVGGDKQVWMSPGMQKLLQS